MMPLDSWLAFTAATVVLLIIPGPTLMLVVSYALGQGTRAALPAAVGVALGDFTSMTLSMLGLGALLATSAELYSALRWAGAVYLVWLGVKLWRAGGTLAAEPARDRVAALKMVVHTWAVTALNPKSITFFVAFLPQFMDPARDFATQMLVFESTFVVLAFVNALAYALLAGRARGFMRSEGPLRTVNRIGGGVLIGAGVMVAASKG